MKITRTVYKVTAAGNPYCHEPEQDFYFKDAKKAEKELLSWMGYAHGVIVEQTFNDETFKVTEKVVGRYWSGSDQEGVKNTAAPGFYLKAEYDAISEEFYGRLHAKHEEEERQRAKRREQRKAREARKKAEAMAAAKAEG